MSSRNRGSLNTLLRVPIAACALLALASCAVGPDFVRPDPPEVKRYTREALPEDGMEADGKQQRFVGGDAIAADWWRLFNSPELDSAVREAIANNASLQSAQASLRQSQANLQAGYGVFYPQLDLGFSAVRQRTSPLRLGINAVVGTLNLFTLSTAVSYAIDLFGGNRRAVEALGAEEDYQRNLMLATYMTLTGNVVNTLIAHAAYKAQIDATQRLIASQQEQLALIQARAKAGTVPYSNVLSIQRQIAANQAALPELMQRRDQAEHLLATLMGRAPAEWTPSEIDLARLELPSDLPVSLPSELVRQRPDILAAEAQLHAASAGIGVATAAMFPSLSLNAEYGGNSQTIGSIGDSNNRFWSIGPSVNQPLFQGGTLWHRRGAAVEAYQRGLSDYRQTVLDALAQVANTLRALQHDAQSLKAQSEGLQAAEQAARLIDANYRAGIASYLEVMVVNEQLQQSRVNYLQALAQRHQNTAALFVALGGGWWNDPELASHGRRKEAEQ